MNTIKLSFDSLARSNSREFIEIPIGRSSAQYIRKVYRIDRRHKYDKASRFLARLHAIAFAVRIAATDSYNDVDKTSIVRVKTYFRNNTIKRVYNA